MENLTANLQSSFPQKGVPWVVKIPQAGSDNIRVSLLSHGILVVTEFMTQIASASLGLWLDKGSRDEQPASGGISHFFEHMVFKGTSRRTPFEQVNELEVKGGQINAFTSKEQICLYCRVVGGEVDTALNVLLDMIDSPQFPEEELVKEREVVLEEIRGADDNPDERVYDLFSSALFEKQGPGLPITGTEKSVESLTRQHLLTHLQEIQRLRPIVITAVGKVDHDRICQGVEAITAGAKFAGERRPREHQEVRYACHHLTENMDVQQAVFHLGTGGYPFSDPRCYALAALSTILGDGMSSLLFQELREKYGYVYQVSTFTEYMADCGLFGISFNTEPGNLPALMEELQKILSGLKRAGISQKQLDFAKAYIQGNYYLEQESTQSRMAYLARMVLQGEESLSRELYLEPFQRLTLQDVNEVAVDLFNFNRWASAAILPEGQEFNASAALNF